MTVRTTDQLKDLFLEKDPYDYNVDLIDTFGAASMLVAGAGVYYVDSTNAAASDSNPGTDPAAPLATLDGAFGVSGLAAGDIIFVMPGHNEGLGDAQIDLDVAGVTVIGLGSGKSTPRIDFDHANASIDVGANNVTLANIRLLPSVTGVLIGIDVETDVTGVVLSDIEWMMGEDGAGVDEFVKALHLTSGNHDTVMRNLKVLAHASAAGATHGIHVDAASHRLTFDNVVIDGPYATNGILEDAQGLNHVVVDCSVDTTGTNYGFHATSTFAKRAGNLDGGEPESVAGGLGSSTDATTDTVHGKLGTDTELSDRSLFDLLAGDGPATYPAAAAPANDVSLAEVIRHIWNVLRNGTGGSEPGTNLSIMDYLLGTAGAYIPQYGIQVTKDCDLSAANDDLFDVTGKVLVTLITGEVTGGALTGAESFQLRVKTSNEPLNAATTIDSDAEGTMYLVTGDVGVTLNGGDAPVTNVAQGAGVPHTPLVIGQTSGSLTIESNTTGNGGTVSFTLYYWPLEAGASVAAAA